MGAVLETFSFCKVNLLLNILGKRPDGFHEVETLMHPVALRDYLTFQTAGRSIRLTCSDPRLPVDSRNLVYRAAALFFKTTGTNAGVRIGLRKEIPIAAGLGGGSANAAATLLALNELFGNPASSASLKEMAAALGSDVPFFLQPLPALATGRGETIEPLNFFPALEEAWLLLAHPGFGIPTPWAYRQLERFPDARNGQQGRAAKLISLLQRADLAAAAGQLYNSLETPALEKYPLLKLFRQYFLENGAAGALMSGSGSAVFALCASWAEASRLLDGFKAKFGPAIWTALLKLGAFL